MQFEVYQGKKIEVKSNGKIYLTGELQKGSRYRVKLVKDNFFILEWALPALLWFSKVDIIFQNLPLPIFDVRSFGLFSFEMTFGENTILVRLRPFRKAYYFIYFNGEKIGEVFFSKKLTLGNRQFKICIYSHDETINLYVIISFLLQLIPV